MRHTLVEHTHQGTSCLTPLPVPSRSSQTPLSCPSHPYTLPVRSNNTHQILSRAIQSIQITHLKPIRVSNYTAIFIHSYTLDPYGKWNGTGPFPIQPLRSPYLHTQNCRLLLPHVHPVSYRVSCRPKGETKIGGPHSVGVGPNLHYFNITHIYPHHHRPTIHG
jgi:hypothetical protein